MNGLDRLDPGTGTFVHYRNDPANSASLSVNTAVSFLLDGESLWVGTWGGGVNRLNLADPASLDPRTARFEIFRHDPQDPRSLSEDGVWTMLKASDGTVWLGTQGGLNRFNAADRSFKSYREKDGLRNATVLGVLEAGNGELWLTTNNGLARFDPRQEKFSVYDVSDGLQGNEFNSNAYFKSASGEIFIGGSHGFNVFNPEQIRPNPVAPPVVITGFKIFNTPLRVDLSGRTPLKLNYDQNFIAFEFAALDFQAPQKNQYAYKLEGFDKDWVEAGTRNYASYTNLPGGEYTFRVRAANSDGVWNETGISLPLSVTPPFWQTWEFQVGLALGLAALVAVGFRWRVRAVREQNVRLQAMVTEQQRVEAELRASEARFRAMFVNSAAGIGLLGLDRKIIDANPAMCAMLGRSLEELVGETPALATYQEDYAGSTAQFEQLLSGELDHYVTERRYIHRDGTVFWASVSMSVVRDDGGRPLYLIGLIVNIDAQKQAQARLAAQEAEYRRTLEQRVEERTHALAEANLRLLEEIEQRKRVEEALASKAAEDAVTAERTRLARDLHDAVTQTLFAASLIAEVLPELWAADVDEALKSTEELRQLTRGALAEMRTLLLELRPAALTQTRLSDLLRQLCEALIGRARLPIKLVVKGTAPCRPKSRWRCIASRRKA
jgi:PAS domain S-box-containing protein